MELSMLNFELCEEMPSLKAEQLTSEASSLEGDYEIQLKEDGERLFMLIEGGKITKLLNRRGSNKISAYPIFKSERFGDNSAILDGEMVVRIDGKSKLNELLKTENRDKVQFVAFDILYCNGEDLREKTLRERQEYLIDFLQALKPSRIELVKSSLNFHYLWALVMQNNLEGVVVKDLDGIYAGYRSGNWKKVKKWEETQIKFTAYEITKTGITLVNGGDRVACNGEKSKEVKKLIDTQGFAVCEVQYLEKSNKNKLRFPSFKRLAICKKCKRLVKTQGLCSNCLDFYNKYWSFKNG